MVKIINFGPILFNFLKSDFITVRYTFLLISNSIFDPLSLRFSEIVATWLATVEPQIVFLIFFKEKGGEMSYTGFSKIG